MKERNKQIERKYKELIKKVEQNRNKDGRTYTIKEKWEVKKQ